MHKGLHKPDGRFLLDDHIHFNPKGQKRYFCSVRAAIMHHRER
jgi:hypothetical protein